VPSDSRENLKVKAQSLVQSSRFAITVVVADEHSGCSIIGLTQQVRVEVLLLRAPVRHQHRRLGRQVHPVLDPGAALVLTQPVIRVSVAVLTPRLAGDRLDDRRGQGATQDSPRLRQPSVLFRLWQQPLSWSAATNVSVVTSTSTCVPESNARGLLPRDFTSDGLWRWAARRSRRCLTHSDSLIHGNPATDHASSQNEAVLLHMVETPTALAKMPQARGGSRVSVMLPYPPQRATSEATSSPAGPSASSGSQTENRPRKGTQVPLMLSRQSPLTPATPEAMRKFSRREWRLNLSQGKPPPDPDPGPDRLDSEVTPAWLRWSGLRRHTRRSWAPRPRRNSAGTTVKRALVVVGHTQGRAATLLGCGPRCRWLRRSRWLAPVELRMDELVKRAHPRACSPTVAEQARSANVA